MNITPITCTPRKVPAGGMVNISCSTYSSAGVLTTPGTSIKVRIYDPSGNVLLALAAMTTTSAGVHNYNYQTVVTHIPGECGVEIQAVHTDGTTIMRSKPGDPFTFIVE